jgi:hypothetical protein
VIPVVGIAFCHFGVPLLCTEVAKAGGFHPRSLRALAASRWSCMIGVKALLGGV